MDTKPLERFATWARRELLTVVDAQASAVLMNGSVARTERPDAVRRLESEIERDGRQHVIDKVAYTWFNRIIALRFMDARGYTNAGIVSPAKGQEHGQPEILADAKRGNLDRDVITSTRTADAILGLLDGTRHSTDAEGEAYALLLTEYCHHWHKSMPFMFEREGTYTELLVPANLLADGAILSRAREALTEDVCEDVEVIGWLYQFYISERKDEVLAGFKNNKKAGADEITAATQLFTPHWIVRYLVENSVGRLWMLNHPESRLVEQMEYYIAPVDDQAHYLRINEPEELTVIDPACGSGHMLTYAYDLLYAIYEEQGYAPSEIPGLILTHNLFGTEIDPRAAALAAFALSMKARANQRTYFSRRTESNICVIKPLMFRPDELDVLSAEHGTASPDELCWDQFQHADVLGSLIQPDSTQTKHIKTRVDDIDASNDILYAGTVERARKFVQQAEILSKRYAVVAANPPYMGSGNMGEQLFDFVKEKYPNEKQDLYACFIRSGLDRILPGGVLAVVTGDTWMFIKSFEDLRTDIVARFSFGSFIHVRDSGNLPSKFGANAAFTLVQRGGRSGRSSFVRTSMPGVDAKRLEVDQALKLREASENYHLAATSDFGEVPGSPIAYWLTEGVREAFSRGKPLRDIASPRQGLITGDVRQFVRFWFEVSAENTATGCSDASESVISHAKWFPYNNGGDFRKWYGNHEDVVHWLNDGEAVRSFGSESGGKPKSRPQNLGYYFRPSVAWTAISSSSPSFRMYPAGFIPSNAGMACYANDDELIRLTSVCNSSTAEILLAAIAPTMNFGVGEIGKIPIVGKGLDADVRVLVEDLVSAAQHDNNDFETSWNFKRPSWLQNLGNTHLSRRMSEWSGLQHALALEQARRESENNRIVAEAYGLADIVPINVPLPRVSLTRNVEFRYGGGKTAEEYELLERADLAAEIVSYAVGCAFGRYSLDDPGLVLAKQGATLEEYLAKIPVPLFRPDADNVIPFVDGGWFEDDIVERFRQFLRFAFGSENFEENLRFVEGSLGVKSIRDYFVARNGKSKFYDDHVQRYKKRPIYWMFSSPKGSFNALIYMHRYNPQTVSTVLNEYLREYRAKLEIALADAENAAAGGSVKDQKEADRLRKVLVELAEYEHDVLYPLAARQLPIDLDDGVLVNYLRFGRALKDIGLEKDRRKVEGWAWPRYPIEVAK